MDFSDRLIRGEIVSSYQNLIIDVKFREGDIVPVFCPELDYMRKLYTPGTEVWVTKNRDQRRRLRYECQIVNNGGGLIMVNPNHVDALFEEAFEKGLFTEFDKYDYWDRTDERFATRNINYELSNDKGEKCYVYVVNIYNKIGPNVVFPTVLNFYEMELFNDMRKLRDKGFETFVVLLTTRMDCLNAKFTWDVNPIAAAKIYDEAKNGLKFCCYGCKIDNKSISITQQMKILY